MRDVRVIILAGGLGTRLKPYTTILPKPLIPIGDMPILEVVLRQLRALGFRLVTISVNHLADLIQAFFGDGSKLGLEISYCIEDEPLGTAGSIALVDDLTDTFLVMNGDVLTTLDYRELVDAHIPAGADATVGVVPREVRIDFGVLERGPGGELQRYEEKPTLQYLVSMGINAFDRSVLEFVPRGRHLHIPTLMTTLKDAGRKVLTHQGRCEWLDIGKPDDYTQAFTDFERARGKYLREPG